ncbi:hypothetical protein VBM87_01325 [Mycoplasma sp. 744]|uniref:hypothetical protein n=1 Tax=Mycoplasma sp. 744 TaxID=3108531 RepID=UPI002B1E2664|nr:hypothetical protein [Mycoplasma sp. 744]MEA4115422.1 hypothetical protein [Mycoplasma sp. 744]
MTLFDLLKENKENNQILHKKLYEVTIWSKTFKDFDKTKQLKNLQKYSYLSAKQIEELSDNNGNIKLLN